MVSPSATSSTPAPRWRATPKLLWLSATWGAFTARTLAAFTAQLRDQLDADALTAEICGVVEDTVQPAHVSLWVPTPERGAA